MLLIICIAGYDCQYTVGISRLLYKWKLCYACFFENFCLKPKLNPKPAIPEPIGIFALGSEATTPPPPPPMVSPPPHPPMAPTPATPPSPCCCADLPLLQIGPAPDMNYNCLIMRVVWRW